MRPPRHSERAPDPVIPGRGLVSVLAATRLLLVVALFVCGLDPDVVATLLLAA